MQSQDNASAARTCLILTAIGAAFVLIVCLVVGLGLIIDFGGDDHQPEDQRGTVVADDADEQPVLFSVMDVGQGACVVVITPDGKVLVADAGRSQERVRRVVIPYLREHGVERIDYVVATNPDQDHIGGLPALLDEFEVGAWVDPVVETTNQTYAALLEQVDQLGIEPIRARRGGTLDMGPRLTAEILWPVDPLMMDGSEESHNDNSIVIKLVDGDVSFLITGDIEAPAEEALVEEDDDEQLRADVMVVPHHGSNTSSTAEFLDAISPTVAIIPVGLDNQYGHPRDETLQRLRFRGIRVYRTDLDGTVEVRSNGDEYQVEVLGTEDGS
ncbi:MAG TPA: ComEC/Rec2 family competence protein [Thermomicrobiales bacterium]|nr:ComEC/Rec2 family competence protein [Thermomicrobiales bacterium]